MRPTMPRHDSTLRRLLLDRDSRAIEEGLPHWGGKGFICLDRKLATASV